jgi:hypothetical protein
VTIPLPTSISTASQWEIVGWRRFSAKSPAAVGSSCTALLPQLSSGEMWLVDRAVVTCTSAAATSVRLYDSSPDPNRLLSGSNSGNFDEADYPAGLLVESGSQLIAVWSNATAGAVGTINVQARVLRQVPV